MVRKPLYSDAGSGIIFNLAGDVAIGEEALPEGVILLPISTRAETIVLASGAQLAGIRFHPAVGYGVLGQHYDKPTLLSPEHDQLYRLYRVYAELRMQKSNERKVDALHRWADTTLDVTKVIPDPLQKALACIEQDKAPGQLSQSNDLSQRQIERLFKLWLGMPPKRYQRILRIRKAISFLRMRENVNLADVAQQFGFCDQAHMTREFRSIARITPGQV
ncbi:helix-turn-helix domain-containing protein [Marinobacter salexigens]|uniref:helix-turn-helix domain-containing protein n=1 Tax=Marinobacter salexigens TaxID=1925763 RepID=UPI002090F476|nr:helix-turn-helix domain-containing protein [Marinobacter salexigens]